MISTDSRVTKESLHRSSATTASAPPNLTPWSTSTPAPSISPPATSSTSMPLTPQLPTARKTSPYSHTSTAAPPTSTITPSSCPLTQPHTCTTAPSRSMTSTPRSWATSGLRIRGMRLCGALEGISWDHRFSITGGIRRGI